MESQSVTTAEERQLRAIRSRIRELLSRRGTSIEEVGRLLGQGDSRPRGGDARQLRRILKGDQTPNVHLLTELSRLLACSVGWLIAGVGHPDVEEQPLPDVFSPEFERETGLAGLPQLLQRRILHLAWYICLKQEDGRADSALAHYRPTCAAVTRWLRGPFGSGYFELPLHEMAWIDYGVRVLEGLESLTLAAPVASEIARQEGASGVEPDRRERANEVP